jgi:hypothetical protein
LNFNLDFVGVSLDESAEANIPAHVEEGNLVLAGASEADLVGILELELDHVVADAEAAPKVKE